MTRLHLHRLASSALALAALQPLHAKACCDEPKPAASAASAAAAESNLESQPLAATEHHDVHLVSWFVRIDCVGICLQIGDGFSAQLDNDVSRLDASGVGRAAGAHPGELQPFDVGRRHVGDGPEIDVRTRARARHRRWSGAANECQAGIASVEADYLAVIDALDIHFGRKK